jgi:hypothetical protein
VAGQTILPSIFWQKISPRKPFVCETQYNKKIGEGVFEWVTRVEFVDLFKQSPPTDNLFLPNERIRISKFDVIWTAEISDSREFSNPKLSGIKLSEGFLEYPLFSTKACYGFLSENQSDFFQANNLGLSGFNASETGNLLKNLLGEFTTPPNVITPPKFEQ